MLRIRGSWRSLLAASAAAWVVLAIGWLSVLIVAGLLLVGLAVVPPAALTPSQR